MDTLLTMSKKELTRLEVIQRLKEKRLRQKQAAEMLGISERHVRRLLSAYCKYDEKGLISKRRGKPSNNQLKPEIKQQAIDLLHSCYHDFGPTLAHEKLSKLHELKLSVESVRKIMIGEEIWRPRKVKHKPVHQLRPRRSCRGELVQIDGSPHAWFDELGTIVICLYKTKRSFLSGIKTNNWINNFMSKAVIMVRNRKRSLLHKEKIWSVVSFLILMASF